MTKTPEENQKVSNSTPLKTPEEKAREEAETMISEYANNSHISREYYAEGYLSGYHSRDEEVQELREALKEITNALQERCDKYGMSPTEYEVLAKAKQLLNK